MPTFVVIRDKWDNILGKKTGSGQDTVNEMVTLAKDKKIKRWENWDY